MRLPSLFLLDPQAGSTHGDCQTSTSTGSSTCNFSIRAGMSSSLSAAEVIASDLVGYVSADLIETPVEKATVAWNPLPIGVADNVTAAIALPSIESEMTV